MNSIDWCVTCQRVVPEGEEHDYIAHGSTRERAEEMLAWKRSFEQERQQ